MDSSFADQEKRFILAEMIKASQIDVDAVVGFIKTCGISPDWLEMQIPHGRTVNQCRQAAVAMGIETPPHLLSQQHYRQLGQQHPTQHPQHHPQVQSPLPANFSTKRKTTNDSSEHNPKRLAMGPAEIQSASHPRSIQPRPANGFVSVNPSAVSATSSPARNVPKKRGRPSRADKDAQARASGSVSHPFPYLAPASKSVAENETTPSTPFESTTKMTPEGQIPGAETRDEFRSRQRSFDSNTQPGHDPTRVASELYSMPLKPEISPTRSVSREDPSESQATSKLSPAAAANPPFNARVAVADLLKTTPSTVMTTGV